jgi:hypothetical protein
MTQTEFLTQNIFKDLKNLNDGFDKAEKQHFSPSQFETILERVEKEGLGIYTLECWKEGKLVDTANHESFKKKATNAAWYKKAFLTFKLRHEDGTFTAVYKVSKKLLDKN